MTEITLPGLVDVHTHLRVPGGEHKEDFASGTAAALAGGFTTILAMPNTSPPLTTPDVMRETAQTARSSIRCDVGLFAGASPEQIEQLPSVAPYAVALKIYLNDTYGPLRVEDIPTLMRCFETWPPEKLIAMHAEQQSIAVGIGLAAAFNRPVHFCHVSRKEEIELIDNAKRRGLPITCEVAPHHLFLTKADAERLGPLADMRPLLGTQDDVDALWDHINDTIDCIATDHAPHTLAEKQSAVPPPGVAGLETALPLMLTAMKEGRIAMSRLIELMATNPRQIFGLPEQPDTQVDVDLLPYRVNNQTLLTKCGWTPFDGKEVIGHVRRVILRGQVVFERGLSITEPGSGRLLP